MQEDIDQKEWDNHFSKNDLNQYNEAYLKYRATMRKFEAPDKKK